MLGSLALFALAAMLLQSGCESASHDNIDRWLSTQKGPDKLKNALRDSELGPDLRAHAGQNLIRMDEHENVVQAFETMDEAERQTVLEKLVSRLWQDARIDGEFSVPSSGQVGAKDALFELRRFAVGAVLQVIDGYLLDWLTGGYYAGRARQGRFRGALIMRNLGPKAAPKLLRAAKSIVASPPDEKGRRVVIEAALMLGLAATGSPEAVDFVLKLVNLERDDPGLSQRAFDALYQGYVKNENLFDIADGKALVPYLDRLVGIAQDETRSTRMVNDAIRLIGAAGPPDCIKPLVELTLFPHENEDFLWVAANAAVQCGKAQAIVPVAEALPENGSYERRKLAGALWEPVAALSDKKSAADQARILLRSKSWVARIIGVELLGHLSLADRAADDARYIGKLENDKTILRGWWGSQRNVPRADRKPLPRLGQRAAQVASELAKLAPGSGK